ncbi:hypothetical protein G7046_g2917 [Stylonectria norvegica]|nr:hypothetical protein G7046_g2917 [Stylonectria norvegica]
MSEQASQEGHVPKAQCYEEYLKERLFMDSVVTTSTPEYTRSRTPSDTAPFSTHHLHHLPCTTLPPSLPHQAPKQHDSLIPPPSSTGIPVIQPHPRADSPVLKSILEPSLPSGRATDAVPPPRPASASSPAAPPPALPADRSSDEASQPKEIALGRGNQPRGPHDTAVFAELIHPRPEGKHPPCHYTPTDTPYPQTTRTLKSILPPNRAPRSTRPSLHPVRTPRPAKREKNLDESATGAHLIALWRDVPRSGTCFR